MIAGPCLCGDPYCPSCGNPSRAEVDKAIETACDILADCETGDEVRFIIMTGKAALQHAKPLIDKIRVDARLDIQEEIFELQNKLEFERGEDSV